MKITYLFAILLFISTINAQVTSHTYGPVKENNFGIWYKALNGTPTAGTLTHRCGSSSPNIFRNFNYWTWSYNDIPTEATVYKVNISFKAGKSSPYQNLNITMHNINATWQTEGLDLYSECKTENEIYTADISHNNGQVIFDITFTSSNGSDVVTALNSAVQSGNYFFTLGIKCIGTMLDPTWGFRDINGIGTIDDPAIDLKIYYTTPNQSYNLYNKIGADESYGSLIVDENTVYPITSGGTVSYVLNSEHNIRTNELPFVLDWNSSSTQKHQFWQAGTKPPENVLNFNLKANLSETPKDLYANFSETQQITIKSYLDGVNEGEVQMKDPWYYFEYLGDWFQTHSFYPYGSSYTFDNTTSNSYGGVFLGQGYTDPNTPYYTVKTTSPQLITNVQGKDRQSYFQNWEADPVGSATFKYSSNQETPVVFNQANATVKAIMKGTGLSSNNLTFDQNNQRKIVRTDNGNLHMVYESLDKVWYERSTDDGATWTIMNSGAPLSNEEAKLPSIDFSYNKVMVSFQEKDASGGYKIKLQYFDTGSLEDTEDIFVGPWPLSYSVNAYPVVSFKYYSINSICVVWKAEAAGLKYWYGKIDASNEVSGITTGDVTNTDNNSTLPAIVNDKSTIGISHLVWQQNNSTGSSIKYIKMDFDTENEVDFLNYSEPSANGSEDINFNPSIAITNNQPRVVWLTDTGSNIEGNLSTNFFSTLWSYAPTVFSNGSHVEIESIVVNSLNSTTGYVVSYSGDGYKVRYHKDDGTNAYVLPYIYDDFVQLSNGDAYTDMVVESFNTASSPYAFSSSIVDATLSKTSTEDEAMKGRRIVFTKDKSKLQFEVRNIIIDNEVIDFIKVEDTLIVVSKKEAINLFETEDFLLSDNSNFSFNVSYSFVDKENLVEYFNLEFQLVDAKTNKTIGVLEKLETSKINSDEYSSITYVVDTEGIGNERVKLKLVIDKDVADRISIANTYSVDEALPKENGKTVAYNETLAITDYALLQNYPNPFNPSTTIKYQIPADGFVSVKIYDITGSKVTTLVNRAQTKGRYQVNFDASNLSSGVYFYRIRSGSFVKTMKMILLR